MEHYIGDELIESSASDASPRKTPRQSVPQLVHFFERAGLVRPPEVAQASEDQSIDENLPTAEDQSSDENLPTDLGMPVRAVDHLQADDHRIAQLCREVEAALAADDELSYSEEPS